MVGRAYVALKGDAIEIYSWLRPLRPNDTDEALMALATKQSQKKAEHRLVVRSHHWPETAWKHIPARHNIGPGIWRPLAPPDAERHTPPPRGVHHYRHDRWMEGLPGEGGAPSSAQIHPPGSVFSPPTKPSRQEASINASIDELKKCVRQRSSLSEVHVTHILRALDDQQQKLLLARAEISQLQAEAAQGSAKSKFKLNVNIYLTLLSSPPPQPVFIAAAQDKEIRELKLHASAMKDRLLGECASFGPLTWENSSPIQSEHSCT